MSQGKNDTAAQVKQFIAGANKHFPNGSEQLQVGGATFTVTGLTALMQSFVDNRQAAEAARTALKAKVETERTRSPSQLAVVRAFETLVRGTFGSAEALADFGLAPPKARAPQTAEQKAVAAAKRAATRTARGTLGKNQRPPLRRETSGVLPRFALRAASADATRRATMCHAMIPRPRPRSLRFVRMAAFPGWRRPCSGRDAWTLGHHPFRRCSRHSV